MKRLIIFLFGILYSVVLSVQPVFAATDAYGLNATAKLTPLSASIKAGKTLPQLIGDIISVALSLVGIIFLVLALYGGFKWMTARGESDQVEEGRKTIVDATVGIILIVSAYSITNFIFTDVVAPIAGSGPVPVATADGTGGAGGAAGTDGSGAAGIGPADVALNKYSCEYTDIESGKGCIDVPAENQKNAEEACTMYNSSGIVKPGSCDKSSSGVGVTSSTPGELCCKMPVEGGTSVQLVAKSNESCEADGGTPYAYTCSGLHICTGIKSSSSGLCNIVPKDISCPGTDYPATEKGIDDCLNKTSSIPTACCFIKLDAVTGTSKVLNTTKDKCTDFSGVFLSDKCGAFQLCYDPAAGSKGGGACITKPISKTCSVDSYSMDTQGAIDCIKKVEEAKKVPGCCFIKMYGSSIDPAVLTMTKTKCDDEAGVYLAAACSSLQLCYNPTGGVGVTAGKGGCDAPAKGAVCPSGTPPFDATSAGAKACVAKVDENSKDFCCLGKGGTVSSVTQNYCINTVKGITYNNKCAVMEVCFTKEEGCYLQKQGTGTQGCFKTFVSPTEGGASTNSYAECLKFKATNPK